MRNSKTVALRLSKIPASHGPAANPAMRRVLPKYAAHQSSTGIPLASGLKVTLTLRGSEWVKVESYRIGGKYFTQRRGERGERILR